MAIANLSDFKIYDELVHGGMIEVLTQNEAVFNEGSNGCLRLVTDEMLGYYKKESFWNAISTSAISRQDTTSNAAVTPRKLTQGEIVDVKLFRKIEPTDVTYNSFAEIGGDAEGDFSYILGKQVGQLITLEALNTALGAVASAVVSGNTNDVSATETCNFSNILDTIAKMGDNSDKIKVFVMHSKPWFDLLKQGLIDGFERVADGVFNSFEVPMFGRKVIVTDSSALKVTGSPNTYKILGLQENAAVLSKIGGVRMAAQQVLGNEQLAFRMQGEYRYNVHLKGFAYDTANGGINPDATAITTGSNWDKCVTSDLDTAGVLLKTK